MAKPRWHHILKESQRNALRAVDEWNCSTGSYADFVTFMHRAWLYLLHAEFHRDGVDYRYRDPKTGRPVEIDGEPKAWALEDCVKHRFPEPDDPVRRNLELFIGLRNKIEHRYEHALKTATGGKAQASVINYEAELNGTFGPAYSLADRLRFPVFISSIAGGADELRREIRKLPRRTRDLVTRYEADLNQDVLDDLRYDYRIRLVPMVGPKTEADLAINFVRLEDLTPEERKVMGEAGRTGTVIVRDCQVEVAAKGKMLPKRVAQLVEEQLPFHFGINNNTEMWRRFAIRPPRGAVEPWKTNPRYCVYNEPFDNYLYTPAWVTKIVREIGSVDKYRAFFCREPQMKVSDLSGRPRGTGPDRTAVEDQTA